MLYAERLINAFLEKFESHPRSMFSVTDRTRFNIAMFEAVFRAFCAPAFKKKTLKLPDVHPQGFISLKEDLGFIKSTRFSTGQTSNVKDR